MDINHYYIKENEKPLDNIVEDGGFCSIFRTICCIGDSLSSGEFETRDADGQPHYYDFFEYSWGQYIARMTGSKVFNCSRGGMTAKEYLESFADANRYWSMQQTAQAYIIALGVNDLFGLSQEVGTLDEVLCGEEGEKTTFASYYGEILRKIRLRNPEGKLFLVTMPREASDSEENDQKKKQHAALLREIAESLNDTWVIDLYQYAPVYDQKFKEHFYLYGHLNAQGYVLTAKMIASYIDYIIRSDTAAFQNTPFIGTGVHYEKAERQV